MKRSIARKWAAALKDVRAYGNVLYIDTGAVFGGSLTVLEIY